MKGNIFVAMTVVALAAPTASFAQLGGLLSMAKPSSNANAGADLGAQQDSLVRNYIAAGKDVLAANDNFAAALGIKAQVVNAEATSDSLSAKHVEEQDKAISESTAAVSAALSAGAALKDTEAKATYAKGLVSMISGVRKYVGLRQDVQGFSSSLSGASPMQLPKLQAGAYVAKTLPTSVSNLSAVLKSAIDFARSNGVEVPEDATSVL